MSTPEGAILKQILDYLAARHILAFRQNTGAVASEHKGKKRFMRFGVPGMADILAFVPVQCIDHPDGTSSIRLPCVIWLEVKTATGKQSELQRSFQQQAERHGHRYAVVRSVDDVEALLK